MTLPAIPAQIVAGFLALPDLTGMVSDALDLAGLPDQTVPGSLLKPSLPGSRVVGRAVTVRNRARADTPSAAVAARDNRLADIEAHNLAEPGDVVVVQGVENASSLGGIAMAIARRQGEAAIVVDGAVRDIETSREIGLPLYARGVTPATGKWRIETIGVNVLVVICGVPVHAGDIVVADDSGLCFVPFHAANAVLAHAAGIATNERQRQEMIAEGRPIAELAARPRAPAAPEN
ncbi:RraA family protein [Mesorhizobium sp. 8]|uniref:RraA family protein n=1 Tax=Mesorhizobium sp. 8 TaxID=2584466 RepID=UPI0015D6680B|nr:RraA family protein [Mesorhizobium sp. 8]